MQTQAAGASVVTPVPESQAAPHATTTQDKMAVSTDGLEARAGEGTTPRRAPEVLKAGLTEPPVPPRRADSTAEAPSPSAFLERSEVAPELVGGFAAFQAGIAYPRFNREAGVSGRVIVRFVVGVTGVPGSAEVVRSVSPGLDRAAVDAVRAARFTLGLQNGRAVAVRMTLPVTFQVR